MTSISRTMVNTLWFLTVICDHVAKLHMPMWQSPIKVAREKNLIRFHFTSILFSAYPKVPKVYGKRKRGLQYTYGATNSTSIYFMVFQPIHSIRPGALNLILYGAEQLRLSITPGLTMGSRAGCRGQNVFPNNIS